MIDTPSTLEATPATATTFVSVTPRGHAMRRMYTFLGALRCLDRSDLEYVVGALLEEFEEFDVDDDA